MKSDARHRAADLISEIYAAMLGIRSWRTFWTISAACFV
jgi:hypothetical protein